METNFFHGHLHTIYSVRDGSSHLKDVVERIKSIGQKSFSATEHGNIYSSTKLFNLSKELDLKYVLGMECYIAEDYLDTKNPKTFHTTLLADGQNGYKELVKLITLANTKGYARKPRIDLNLLSQTKNIYALSGCLNGPIPQLIRNNAPDDKIHELIDKWNKALNGKFFIEITSNGFDLQIPVNQKLLELNKQHNLKVIPTNDSHSTHSHQTLAQSLLMNIGDDNKKEDGSIEECEELNGMYIRSRDEIKEALEPFSKYVNIDDALNNTLELSDMLTSPDFSARKPKFPVYNYKADSDSSRPFDKFLKDSKRSASSGSYLRYLAYLGWNEKIKNKIEKDKLKIYSDRAKYEIDFIEDNNLADYFLLVYDVLHYCDKNQITYGPGRGSVCGSLTSYLIGITEIDPMPYGLIFERFLNPARIKKGELPDIDLDIDANYREKVIEYLRNKYGEEKISRLVTFGVMKSRAVLSHVGKVLGVPFDEMKIITKLIPITAGRVLPLNDPDGKGNDVMALTDMRPWIEKYPKLFEISKQLEGCINSVSTHPSAIVISNESINNDVPLCLPTKTSSISAAFDMHDIQQLGLVKLDVLGLTEIAIIQEAKELIYNKTKERLNLHTSVLDFKDKLTWTLIASGNTLGIFQLGGKTTKEVVQTIRPNNLEELSLCNTFSRPGPLSVRAHVQYADRVSNPNKVLYIHPTVEYALKPTLGLLAYQEQLIYICRDMCGFTPSETETIRKGVGKKDPEILKKLSDQFISGAVKNNISKEIAIKMWNIILPCADYIFNKSHALGYSVLAYKGAYLKAHYPREFYAAAISNEINHGGSDGQERVVEFLQEMVKRRMPLESPSVQYSGSRCKIDDEGYVLLPLNMAKDVGSKIADIIESLQPFDSLEDFLTRTESNLLRQNTFQALVDSGAIDDLCKNHTLAIRKFEDSRNKKKDIKTGNLFELEEEYVVKDISIKEKADLEKEKLGICLRYSMMSGYLKSLESNCDVTASSLVPGKEVWLGGIVDSVRPHVDRKGETMYFLNISDDKMKVHAIIFSSQTKHVTKSALKPNTIAKFKGHLDNKGTFIIERGQTLKPDISEIKEVISA